MVWRVKSCLKPSIRNLSPISLIFVLLGGKDKTCKAIQYKPVEDKFKFVDSFCPFETILQFIQAVGCHFLAS